MSDIVLWLRLARSEPGAPARVVEQREMPAEAGAPEGLGWMPAPPATTTRLYVRMDGSRVVTDVVELPVGTPPDGDGWIVSPKGVAKGMAL